MKELEQAVKNVLEYKGKTLAEWENPNQPKEQDGESWASRRAYQNELKERQKRIELYRQMVESGMSLFE